MRSFLAVVLCLGAVLAAAPAQAAEHRGTVADGGFESGAAGWRTSGAADADYTEAGGHAGVSRLTHYAAAPYTVETFQTVTGLPRGAYTLRAWVRSGGSAVTIGLRDCGGATERTH